ncbi:hypothetical protein SAMN04244579_01187 [Azotobacter beijerinckii]|uniref:Metal ABC transporter ATPase n=1 Tax=Azotobacter beijerinckii TaxID=170623 RepID=A0A1H6RNE2_9GAMM|nr:DUF6482 family protein [Azotobacter beijerinckii]SEI57273.1 hypothetical protein SAMN04244579_01187 [Azotobacter beijerinckii]
MNMQQLLDQADAGRIDSLELIAIEGGIYLLQAYSAGQRHTLLDEQGRTLQLRSMTQARDLLEFVPRVPFHLVQCVVHNEMCGFDDGPQQPLRIPISLDSAW